MTRPHAPVGPSWDNSSEYISLETSDFLQDLETLKGLIAQIQGAVPVLEQAVARAGSLGLPQDGFVLKTSQDVENKAQKAGVLLSNMSTFVSCQLSVDAQLEDAKAMQGALMDLGAQLSSAHMPNALLLTLCPDSFAEAWLDTPETAPSRYSVINARRLKNSRLSLAEETLRNDLSVPGIKAWGQLYTQTASNLSCTVALPDGGTKTVGVSGAFNMMGDSDPRVREAAYQAFTSTWATQQDTCASILNAITGWNLRVNAHRGRVRGTPVHFLESALHDCHMGEATLNAMLEACAESVDVGRQALRLQAKAMGQQRLHPSHLYAPPPVQPGSTPRLWTFEEGVAVIRDAFGSISPEMAEFVDLCVKNKWIEGSDTPRRRAGAYCTKFAKSRTPRVYMTYAGSMGNVSTLAHELGHAFHNWVMRDMPLEETQYPMNLAETASIMAETIVTERLTALAQDPSESLGVAWEEAGNAATFVCNIPARFRFEKSLYEARSKGKTLSARELRAMMRESLSHYYGDALSDVDETFWMSKLHFYISGMTFYNFPYTFGYLFSLGVYAQKEKMGSEFYKNYVALLRDTGRMDTEELVKKHLGMDVTGKDFWKESLGIAARKVRALENILCPM